MNPSNYFVRFFLGSEGDMSSKRLFTFILIVLFVVVIVSNLFWKYTLKESLEDYLFYSIIFTFSGVAAEKLLKGKQTLQVKEGDKSVTATTNTEIKP